MEAERFESLTAFVAVEGAEAAALLRHQFEEPLAALNADPARLLSDHEAARILPGGNAAVLTVDGVPQILDAGIPLKVEAEDGTEQPVDLTLVEAGNGTFRPDAPLSEVTLPAQADGEIDVGDHGIGIKQLDVNSSSDALAFGDKNTFYSEVATDTDLLVAPISRGVEIFNQLRSPESPEVLRFKVTMPNGAELVPDGIGGAEVLRSSEKLAEIPFPTAVDAQGADVPVTMEVLGDTLVLKVSHRDAGYAYPLLVDPPVIPLNEFWWSASSWYAGANLGVLTDGTWDWDPHATWVYGSSACINGASCWGSGRGLYVTAVNGNKGPGEFGRWIYTPPGSTSFITEAWIAPFHRNNNNPTACSKSKEPEPHDYVGLWTGTGWAPSYADLANDVGSAYLAGGGRELHIGLATPKTGEFHIPCWRDIAAGGASINITDPDVPFWVSAPSAADTWTDTTVVPISTGTTADNGLGVKYFNLYPPGHAGNSTGFIGNTVRPCSGLTSSPCGASWSSTISNYNPSSLPNGVNLLTVYSYDALAIKHFSEGRPVRVKVDHVAPEVAFSGELFTKEPSGRKGLVTATDGSASALSTAQSGVKSVKLYVDGALVDRFPDEASPPACNKVQEGFNIASCKIEAPVELSESLSGTHSFKAVALDSLNHSAEKSTTLELPVDSTPPTLTITGALKEASGLWVKPMELGASLKAEDGGTAIAKVELFVDGESIGSATTSECYEGACKTFEKTFKAALGSYAAGAHTVKAVAKDGAGNEKSESWTINLDPADPTLDPLLAPELPEGWDPQASSFKLEYSAADAHSGVRKVEVLRPSGSGGQIITKPVDSSCTTSCPASVSGNTTISTEDLPQGPVLVTTKAYDAAGRVSSSRSLVVLVDRDDPTIVKADGPLFAPSSGLLGLVTDLDLEVTDKGGGVRSLEFLIEGEPVEVLGAEEIEELGGTEDCDGDTCDLQVSLEPLVGGGFEPGDHEVELVVTDRAGHTASIDNEVTIDTRVPEVELSGTLMDTLGEELDGPVRLDVNTTDGEGEHDSGMASVEVTVDGEPLEGFAPGGEMVAVSDEGNDRVQIFGEEGEFVRAFGSEGSDDGELDRPVGIAIDGDRNVWVADAGNDRVQAFTEEGEHLLTVGSSGDGEGEFDRPEGIAVDSNGNVWVADTGNGRLQVFEPDGDFIEVVSQRGPEPGELGEPVGLGADPNSGVWVADRQYDRVAKFSDTGEFVREFGSTGTGNGTLDQPASVEIGGDGTVWVSDQRNRRIQGFDSEGEYLKQFGTGGGGPGQFTYPAGIAIDNRDRVWAVDSSHSRQAAPPFSPVAAYSFDEGSGTVAEDAFGNHDATIEDATWTGGKFGKALDFDGEDSCVSVPNSVDLQLSEAFTLEAWIRPDNATQWAPVFFKEAEGFYSYSLFFGAFNAGHIQGYVADTPWEGTEVESPGTLAANTWSHVAMTSDRTTLRLYLNGNLVDTASAEDAMESEKPLWIGCSGMWEEKFEGKIDEARIYNRALTQEEIRADKNQAISGASSEDPVAAYPLDAGEGEAAEDIFGENDGEIEDAIWTQNGRFGKALDFDGEDDCLSVPDAPDLQLTEELTLEAWVKPRGDGTWEPIVSKAGSQSIWLGEETGHLRAYIVEDDEDEALVIDPDPIPENVWSHVALTFDGVWMRLYVNGELADEDWSSGAAPSSAPLKIGCSAGEHPGRFEGLIDEVRVYDRALGAGEIAVDKEAAVGALPAGDRIQRWQVSGTPSFDAAFGLRGTGDGEFSRVSDVAVARHTCASGPCGQITEAFVYDPPIWGPGPHTVQVTATDQVGNLDIEELHVNEPLNVVAPECPDGEPQALAGGEPSSAQAALSDIEETAPYAVEPSQVENQLPFAPEVDTEGSGVSLNELGYDVVETEAGGGIEDQAAGSFTVGQSICMVPLETSGAALKPLIANDAAVLYPNSAPDTDTVIRPTAVGTAIVQHFRGEDAPSEFSWELKLEVGEELVELEDGAIAVVDPEGLDLDPEEVPSAPEGGPLGLPNADTQLAEAEHDLAAANAEVSGEVKMVIAVPEIIDTSEKVVPGILRIVGASIVVAELPPGTLAEAEAMIILMSPAAEPESMCMSVAARAPQYAAAACNWEEENSEDEGEGVGPPFALEDLATTANPALNAEILKQIDAYYQEISPEGAGASSYDPEENRGHKKFCNEPAWHRVWCKRFNVDGQMALWAEDDIFNITESDETIANAFRHSLWVALMRHTSPPSRPFLGHALSIAHEDDLWKPSNPRIYERKKSQMDVLNNYVGTNHAGTSDKDACESILIRTRNAHFIGKKVEPFRWQDRVEYEYQRPVYRRLNEKGTSNRVYPTGNDCGDVRASYGRFTFLNPFDGLFNAFLNTLQIG